MGAVYLILLATVWMSNNNTVGRRYHGITVGCAQPMQHCVRCTLSEPHVLPADPLLLTVHFNLKKNLKKARVPRAASALPFCCHSTAARACSHTCCVSSGARTGT